MRHSTSPEGTAESNEGHGSVHTPVVVAVIQSSLRDLMQLFLSLTLKSVGYSQISLREKTHRPFPLMSRGKLEKSRAVSRCAPLQKGSPRCGEDGASSSGAQTRLDSAHATPRVPYCHRKAGSVNRKISRDSLVASKPSGTKQQPSILVCLNFVVGDLPLVARDTSPSMRKT